MESQGSAVEVELSGFTHIFSSSIFNHKTESIHQELL